MARYKTPPTSRIGRIARLGGVSSKVSGSYLGQRIAGVFQDEDTRQKALRKLHLQNAERVVDTMSVLKGAAMKVGQYASVAAEGLDLPDDVGRIFRKLTHKSEPIPFETIKEDVEGSLDAGLETLFSRFDPEPLGTASLGQAHAAWLPDGTAVVVKVLHRGIDKAVDSDLGALRGMLVAGGAMGRRKADVDVIFEEIRERLNEELDYYQEAANLEFFSKAFAGDPDLVVPRTHPSHCSDRIITMDRLTGAPLEVFNDQATREAKQRAGAALARSFHVMLYQLRALQADPHAGNFLVARDGRVGLLDFGCVRRFDLYFTADYARMSLGIVDGDRDMALSAMERMGVIEPHAPQEARDALWALGDVIGRPFRQKTFQAGGPQDRLMEQVKRTALPLVRHPTIHATREFVFLDRALGGTYLMLRALRYETDYGAFVRPWFERTIAEAEGRPIS